MRQVLVLALLVGGCAYTTQSTQVAPMGGDTYSVGATAGRYVGGSTEARSIALGKASAFCAERGLQSRVVSIEPAGERANVTFQCMTPADPRMATPAMAPATNINLNIGR